MNDISPAYLKTNPPGLEEVLDALQRETLKAVNCARIGVIQSFDPGGAGVAATVSVQIAQQQVVSITPEGVRTIQQYPLLLKVPVLFPAGGGFVLTFPIAAGDECLVVFNDRELDNWLATGAGSTPTTPRAHSLSDGIAIVGLRSNPRALQGIATDETQLRNESGNTFVGIKNGDQVRVHGGTVYEWDCHGYGMKISWTGGNNYTIDNYTIGAIVTTNDHAISQPGPP